MKTADALIADVLEELDDMIDLDDCSGPEAHRDLFRRVYQLRELIEFETGRRMLLGPLLDEDAGRRLEARP